MSDDYARLLEIERRLGVIAFRLASLEARLAELEQRSGASSL